MESDELPVQSRTKMDKKYLMLVGETIFLYNMLECTVIDIIDLYDHGIRDDYFITFRYNPSDVRHALETLIGKGVENDPDIRKKLERIVATFQQGIDIRSAVAHGHPSTDNSDPAFPNRQVLSCQTGDCRLNSGKRFPSKNRYDDKQLTFSVLLKACQELEQNCQFAREVFTDVSDRRSVDAQRATGALGS